MKIQGEWESYTLRMNAKCREQHQFDERTVGITEPMTRLNHGDSVALKAIKRRSDEPKLELGTTIEIKEGVIGVVVARYMPSGGHNEVHYIVETKPYKAGRGETRKAHKEELPT